MQAQKYIFRAARIIAPVIGTIIVEGYDWVISILKDQQYMTLAYEVEMHKAIQYLHNRKFSEVLFLTMLVRIILVLSENECSSMDSNWKIEFTH
mgnify:CR=1 FL=1